MADVDSPSLLATLKRGGSSFLVWICAAVCLAAGVSCLVAIKMQGLDYHAVASGELKPFDQPFWQTFLMFNGEALCFIFYFFDELVIKRIYKRPFGLFELPSQADLLKPKTPWWWWGAPAFFDLGGTVLVNVAFLMTYASTVQMLRTSILIITSIFTLILMRRPLRVHEWIGIFIMTGGMIASAINSVIHPDENSKIDSSRSWIGIVLSLMGAVFQSCQMIVEEKIFDKTYASPITGPGWQGVTGWVVNLLVIVACHYGGLYNFAEGWYQLKHSGLLIGTSLWYTGCVVLVNASGILMTFLVSGLLRSVIYSCKAPVLFIIELIVGWQKVSVGGLLSLFLTIIGFTFFSYALPCVGRKRTPKTHKCLRRGVPCFCTHQLPDSEDEEEISKQYQTPIATIESTV